MSEDTVNDERTVRGGAVILVVAVLVLVVFGAMFAFVKLTPRASPGAGGAAARPS